MVTVRQDITVVHDDGTEEVIELSGQTTYQPQPPLPEPVPPPEPPPSGLIFADDFGYTVSPTDPATLQAFLDNGYTVVKSAQDPNANNPRGLLYIENNELVMESLPTALGDFSGDPSDPQAWAGCQTDYYLERQGDFSQDLWIRFYFTPEGNYDHGNKFIYPSRDGFPATDLDWLITISAHSGEPFFQNYAENNEPVQDVFILLETGHANYTGPTGLGHWQGNNLGPNLNPVPFLSGQRYYVEMHIAPGSYEMWVDGAKVAEWIDGVTPDFTFAPYTQGHTAIRFPTTMGGARVFNNPQANFDSRTRIGQLSFSNGV